MIKFDSEICNDFAEASSREWLETNGIGGYASSTISGANSRRYHALLTAAMRPPLGRITMLSKFEETVKIGGKAYELSSNQYHDKVYPEGYKLLTSFRLDPFPIWTYKIGNIEIEKSIFMVYGANTTVCQWKARDNGQRTTDNGQISLELKPLLSFCDYHHLQHEDANFDLNYETSEKLVTVRPYASMPPMYLAHNAESIEKTEFWYHDFEYAIEKERGFDFTEDLFQPFSMKFDLSESAIVVASIETKEFFDVSEAAKKEIARRKELVEIAEAEEDFAKQLVVAADQFIVKRGAGETVIAGYPWFSDWGRDTMIALKGLTLATNRPKIAKNILLEFSRHVSEGMIPNRFPDIGDEPEYNNVDGTLWYFEAVRAYVEKTGDYDFVRESLYAKLAEIISKHLQGTRYNIHVDTDGLLYAGQEGTQLTWMDAKYGDTVFTPRIGKPVEIQALWYNALKTMEHFAAKFGDEKDEKLCGSMATTAKSSFDRVFWNEAESCLYDVVGSDSRDGAVRPNQIFAVSLHHQILDDEMKARQVVEKVEKELLTPVGLRSLSPKDSQYCPIYIGSPYKRDSSYHQGTVWGWLIGGFVDAYRKVNRDSESKVAEFLNGFKAHLNEAGIGQISEIFDADAPHHPRGCFAQAWSIAEVLRVLKAE
jgi:predicted glycogen debranching enzyme